MQAPMFSFQWDHPAVAMGNGDLHMASASKSLFTKRIAGRPLWWHGLVSLGIVLAITFFALLVIASSSAYEVAERYATEHEAVTSAIGTVQSTRLGIGRFGFKLSTPYSTMRFVMVLHGERGTCSVAFVASRRGEHGEWSVDEAVYDGPGGSKNLTVLPRSNSIPELLRHLRQVDVLGTLVSRPVPTRV